MTRFIMNILDTLSSTINVKKQIKVSELIENFSKFDTRPFPVKDKNGDELFTFKITYKGGEFIYSHFTLYQMSRRPINAEYTIERYKPSLKELLSNVFHDRYEDTFGLHWCYKDTVRTNDNYSLCPSGNQECEVLEKINKFLKENKIKEIINDKVFINEKNN